MTNPDLLIYAAHAGFWGSFGATKVFAHSPPSSAGAVGAPAAPAEATAPFSRGLIVFHMLAFAVMYFGIGNAVLPNRVSEVFAGQRVVGALLIAAGAALMSWALVYFRSWRFRAQLDAGHELATGGPFHYVRHPLYLGLNLLAIGTAIWVPTLITSFAAVLMIVGSDLRGRTEETLLRQVFGATYDRYCAQTRRFLPGVY